MDRQVTLHSFMLIVSASLLLSAVSNAQTIGKAEWSNMPFNSATPSSDPLSVTWECSSDGTAYALASLGPKKPKFVGYVFPPKEQGAAFTVPVSLPGREMHYNLNRFTIVGERPCLVYDIWEKSSGKVTFFAQRFTTAFEPDGPAVELGQIALDPKTYSGFPLKLEAIHSADRSKVLFLFTDIKLQGVKLAFCWVMDAELELIWRGAYRLPVIAKNSSTEAYMRNDGHVFVRLRALELNEETATEKKDGTVKVISKSGDYWRNNLSEKWFELYGETFNEWKGDLPGFGNSFSGSIIPEGDRLLMAGFAYREDEKDPIPQWVILEMGPDLTPNILSTGPTEFKKKDLKGSVLTSSDGGIFLHGLTNGEAFVVRFNNELEKAWERRSSWGYTYFHPSKAYVFNDRLLLPTIGSSSNLAELETGDKWSTKVLGRYFPMLLSWDVEGSRTARTLMDKGERNVTESYSSNFDTFGSCGCYIDMSYDKKVKGMVRVRLDP